MPKSSVSKPPRSGVAFLLAQVGAHAASKFAERLRPLKLTPAHAGILRVLARGGGLRQQTLAELLGMFPSRLVLVLDELERVGLVERLANAKDRRAYSVHLTPDGQEMLEEIGRVARAHQDDLCASLNAADREMLAGLLSRIADEQHLRPGIHPGYRSDRKGDS